MGKFYKINQFIQSPKLRVLDSQGEQIGVLTKQEALDKAREQSLDLVEIAPNATPPVAKIVNYQKFKYAENKKERTAKRGDSSAGGLKELWFSPRIAKHDIQVRLNRVEEFLKMGYKVKLTVKFRGRELGHKELGYKVLRQIFDVLGGKAEAENDPKFEGRNLSVVVVKSKGAKFINGQQNGQQNEDKEISSQKIENNISGKTP
ncbi:translation initiation factor IF-3 [Candidatus Daviesbacteria bacterium]|nr:translation initiation factor IF-3 [Candidatus Daviesbacteria bacterium]